MYCLDMNYLKYTVLRSAQSPLYVLWFDKVQELS